MNGFFILLYIDCGILNLQALFQNWTRLASWTGYRPGMVQNKGLGRLTRKLVEPISLFLKFYEFLIIYSIEPNKLLELVGSGTSGLTSSTTGSVLKTLLASGS